MRSPHHGPPSEVRPHRSVVPRAVCYSLGVRARLAFVSFCALLLVIGAACGLDVVGSLDAGVAAQPDATDAARTIAIDGDLPDDAAVEAASLPQVPIGPETETPIADAGAPDAVGDCGSPIIADNFNTAALASRWLTYGTAKQSDDGFGNGYVQMIPTGQGGKVAGLFTLPGFTATSFNASFRYFARQPGGFGSVGDGITFFWVTSGAVSQATLADAIGGGGLGISRTLGGYAFALDAYRNSGINDPSAPSFSLLRVEPAKGAPSSYDWHVQNDGPYSGVYDTWRTITVTFNNGKLSASISGTKLFQNVSIPMANITALGFTAATGGTDALGFYIDTVNIELTDAVCQ